MYMLHADCHTEKDSLATTAALGSFNGGQLRITNHEVSDESCTWKQDKEGVWMKGELHDSTAYPV